MVRDGLELGRGTARRYVSSGMRRYSSYLLGKKELGGGSAQGTSNPVAT